MESLQLNTQPDVQPAYDNYPEPVQQKTKLLRDLVIETAQEIEEVTMLEESLKWGEPAYRSNIGSTLRLSWSPKKPNQYGMYFQCSSRLVPTFRIVFEDIFEFEGKRALIFPINTTIPIEPIKECIKAALTYHKVKHLPTLGI